MKFKTIEATTNNVGLLTLSLRWVIGWTYFSAFWRRLILENKLIHDEAGYIGEKFNHFLPNALGIKPIIEYLVTNPETLQSSMVLFTVIEAVVGLFLILGLFTRLMSLGVIFLALGILLGSGWLGTTCLDEWQIGILGIAGGFTLFLSGSAFSLDNYFRAKNYSFTHKKWFKTWASGEFSSLYFKKIIITISVLIFGLSLFTNQYFHGGVFGKLHNKSVKPKVEISNIKYKNSELNFELFRTEGADVYGSFLIAIKILDKNKNVIKEIEQNELSKFPAHKIKNYYVAKIKPGSHSLILPLGAKANLTIYLKGLKPEEKYTIQLTDISGIQWSADF